MTAAFRIGRNGMLSLHASRPRPRGACQSLLSRDASLLAMAARGRAALSSASYQASYTLWKTFAGVNRRSAASRSSGPCLAWTTRTISDPVAGKSARLRKHAMTGMVGVESGVGLVGA